MWQMKWTDLIGWLFVASVYLVCVRSFTNEDWSQNIVQATIVASMAVVGANLRRRYRDQRKSKDTSNNR
jgi:hypothetical protein